MASREGDVGDFDPDRRGVDHVRFEDGTFVLFDPQDSDAWIECRSPVPLAGRN